MYQGKRILALLPARGGSKRLPGKNVRLLGGRPLIHWTVKHVLDSPSVDRLVVSTDSAAIARAARAAGGEVPFLRPARLSGDLARSIDVAFHALDFAGSEGESYDVLALVEATSPLRRKGDLERAIRILVDHWEDTDAVVGFGEVGGEHPVFAKRLKGDHIVSYLPGNGRAYQRQGLVPAYFAYGGIYVSKVSALRRLETFYPRRLRPLWVERWQHNEIDEEVDFLVAEHLFEKNRKLILGRKSP